MDLAEFSRQRIRSRNFGVTKELLEIERVLKANNVNIYISIKTKGNK